MKTIIRIVGLGRNHQPLIRRLFEETGPAYALSSQAIVTAYANRAISRQEAVDQLVKEGYSPDQAALWLSFMAVATKPNWRKED